MSSPTQDNSELRVALFSGNYNYVRDGANQALNRLVRFLLDQGVNVRVYSATTDTPAFEPAGDLVSIPSFAVPKRPEYRVPKSFSAIEGDLAAFNPNIIHISSPDPVAFKAAKWARERNLPLVSSIHTRFETYFQYYGIGFLEPIALHLLRRLYQRCDVLLPPATSVIEDLREKDMNDDIVLWARGVDRSIFHPDRRSEEWRAAMGIGKDDVVIGFLGRLVMEKGLDIFAEVAKRLKKRGVPHRILVIGKGPAQADFAKQVPDAIFAGFQDGPDLGRAVASLDILLNPSITEAFGNVTLEAMACGIPVVAANATGADMLVKHGETGMLIDPKNVEAYAEALGRYITDPELRAKHGAAGSARADEFHWDKINQVVLDTYWRIKRAKEGANSPA